MKTKQKDKPIPLITIARTILPIFLKTAEGLEPARVKALGRPRANLKRIFYGIFRMLSTGCTYRELDRRYGARSTINKYFLKLAGAGVFQEVFVFFYRCIKVKGLTRNSNYDG